ncbi:hypothetical protein [Streptomyces tateyamensis]|uniref:hypothetical protein n=1 Tax=Streptomyces tateyamensis TaxID=565073 RepID=UPI0011B5A486|nr:hypothetical protein [Streptomyces tateyamensis]
MTLAHRIVDAFSSRGDLVFVPEAGNASCLIAAVKSGRKVLAYAPSNHGADLAYENLHTHAAQIASLAVLRRGRPGALPAAPDAIASAQVAIVAPHNATTPGQLAALVSVSARALTPGGVLVVTTRQSSGQEAAGQLVAQARAAGLVYLQHIVVAEGVVKEQQLPTAASHRSGCACHFPQVNPGRHLLAHHDLLVFTKP